MVYTLGLKILYDTALQNSKHYPQGFKKVAGGSVFKTYQDALNYKNTYNLQEYDVYVVVASWEHTTSSNSEEFNSLLFDSQIIKS